MNTSQSQQLIKDLQQQYPNWEFQFQGMQGGSIKWTATNSSSSEQIEGNSSSEASLQNDIQQRLAQHGSS